jgi:hypothetical protein
VALEHVVLAGDAGVVDGVVEAELEALAGLVGTEEEELLVVAYRETRGLWVLTCLKDAEDEGCRDRGRGSPSRPCPTCACV